MAQRYTCLECGHSFVLSGGGFHTADVKGHCGKVMHVEEISEPGPRQPLDEMRRDIAAARAEIARLRAIEVAARAYLLNSTPVNAVELDKALKKSREEKQG